MLTLSVLEMWIHNAYEHGAIGITAATAAGVALYYYGQPYLPDFEGHKYEQVPAEPELAHSLVCPHLIAHVVCCH